MKNVTGFGAVKSVGDKKLTVVKDADGTVSSKSEGYFTYSAEVPTSFPEVIAYYEQKDNALTDTNEAGEKVTLDAEASIVKIIANEIERAAKANAYQKTVAKFKPAEDPKAAFDKIVRTFMSMGLPEDLAIEQTKRAIAENEARQAASTETESA